MAQRLEVPIARPVALLLLAVVLVALVLVATNCSGQACAGQCGPPFQLQVVFRPGTSSQAAIAAMDQCANNPQVVRVGRRVYRFQGTPNRMEPAGSRTATIYTRMLFTRTRSQGRQQLRLLACLRQSPLVESAGFPD